MLRLSLLALLGVVAYVTAPQTPLQAVQAGLTIAPEVAGRVPGIIDSMTMAATERPLFVGPRGVDATVLLMAAIVNRESSWRADVADCTVRGDHGSALGLPQEHARPWIVGRYTVAEFCDDVGIQMRVHLAHLWLEREHCKGGPAEMIAGWHAGLSCAKDAVSRGQNYDFNRLLNRAAVTVVQRRGVWIAE